MVGWGEGGGGGAEKGKRGLWFTVYGCSSSSICDIATESRYGDGGVDTLARIL